MCSRLGHGVELGSALREIEHRDLGFVDGRSGEHLSLVVVLHDVVFAVAALLGVVDRFLRVDVHRPQRCAVEFEAPGVHAVQDVAREEVHVGFEVPHVVRVDADEGHGREFPSCLVPPDAVRGHHDVQDEATDEGEHDFDGLAVVEVLDVVAREPFRIIGVLAKASF